MCIGRKVAVSFRLGLLVSCLGLVAQAPTTPPAHTLTPTQIQTFKATFQRLCEERRVVGGSALILENGRDLLFVTYGLQDAATKSPVTRATAFHWASITKTFTTIAVLQARDRGLLSLEDPITKYLPELRKVHNPFGSMDAITLRQLLTHSAGFRDSTWPWKKGKDWEPFEPTEWSQLVAMLPYSEIEFAPGTQSRYSNLGYIFLGRVIELVTGEPFVSYVEKNILRPLGMNETYFDRAPYHLISRRSHSYTWMTTTNSRKENPFDFLTGVTTANGGLTGPLTDMAKYVRFLMSGAPGTTSSQSEVPVLNRASLEELLAPACKSSIYGDETWRTLGFFLAPFNGDDWLEHSGMQNGFRSMLEINSKTGRALILVFNTDDDWDGEKKMPEGFLPAPPLGKVVGAYLDLASPVKAQPRP